MKPVFHFNRIVLKSIVFLCFLSTRASGTNDFDTKENTTARYDTIEVENRLKFNDTKVVDRRVKLINKPDRE